MRRGCTRSLPWILEGRDQYLLMERGLPNLWSLLPLTPHLLPSLPVASTLEFLTPTLAWVSYSQRPYHSAQSFSAKYTHQEKGEKPELPGGKKKTKYKVQVEERKEKQPPLVQKPGVKRGLPLGIPAAAEGRRTSAWDGGTV